MATIGQIPSSTTSPSDNYIMEIENPDTMSYKITWATILALTRAYTLLALADVAISGNYSDLEGLPVLFSGNYGDLEGIPAFADVAFSGSYNYLSDVPDTGADGHIIQDEGVDKPSRSKLNFIGATVTDDVENDATIITIEAGASDGEWLDGGIKTSSFTAISQHIYYLDTSSSYITVTLPFSGKVRIVDILGNSIYTGFGERNVTVLPGSGTIMGSDSLILDRGALAIELGLVGTDWRLI